MRPQPQSQSVLLVYPEPLKPRTSGICGKTSGRGLPGSRTRKTSAGIEPTSDSPGEIVLELIRQNQTAHDQRDIAIAGDLVTQRSVVGS